MKLNFYQLSPGVFFLNLAEGERIEIGFKYQFQYKTKYSEFE